MALKVNVIQVRAQLEHDRIVLDAAIQREKIRMVRSLVVMAKLARDYLAPEFLRFYEQLEKLLVDQPYEVELIGERLDEVIDFFGQKNPTFH